MPIYRLNLTFVEKKKTTSTTTTTKFQLTIDLISYMLQYNQNSYYFSCDYYLFARKLIALSQQTHKIPLFLLFFNSLLLL